jgi:hypothetical protein
VGHSSRTCNLLVVVQTNIYQVRLYYVGNVVLYIISVHVGRNFHVLYSCVVIIFMMFRGCSLLLSH